MARPLPPAAPQRRHKRRRLGDGTAAWLRAERPNHVWALDFQFDETAQRRRLKLLNVIDEFTREALAIHVDHSIGVDDVELATLGWVHWWNTGRIHSYLDDQSPDQFEAAYAASNTDQTDQENLNNQPAQNPE